MSITAPGVPATTPRPVARVPWNELVEKSILLTLLAVVAEIVRPVRAARDRPGLASGNL